MQILTSNFNRPGLFFLVRSTVTKTYCSYTKNDRLKLVLLVVEVFYVHRRAANSNLRMFCTY